MSRSRKKNAEQGYIFSIFGQEAIERSIDIFFSIIQRSYYFFDTKKKTTVVLIISIFFNSVRLPLKKNLQKNMCQIKFLQMKPCPYIREGFQKKRGNIDLIKRGKIDCLEKYIYPWSNPSAAPCDTGLRKF